MKYKHSKCARLFKIESILIEFGLSVATLLFGKDIEYFFFIWLLWCVATLRAWDHLKTSTIGHVISKQRLALDAMRRGEETAFDEIVADRSGVFVDEEGNLHFTG